MPTNIISTATITASDTYSGYPLSNLIDGNLSTFWRATYKEPQWVLLDFGQNPIKIGILKIAGVVNRAKTFILQGSSDALNFTDLYTGTQPNDNTLTAHPINSSTAYRYYRIYVTENYGTNYGVGLSEIEVYEATINFKSSGNAIVSVAGITATIAASSISWTEDKPTGTTLSVSASTDGTNYSAVTNGNALLAAGTVLNNATIYVKVEMATTDATVTPTLSNLAIGLQSTADLNSIVLEMQPLERFESAAGAITVTYDGAGALAGAGGAVEAFSKTFSPTELVPKPDQNDEEHIAITEVTASGTLTKIYYTNTKEDEHLEITNITAVGVLTHINDI